MFDGSESFKCEDVYCLRHDVKLRGDGQLVFGKAYVCPYAFVCLRRHCPE